MYTEPEQPETTQPGSVTVTTTVASEQFGELSKRVDQTHALVLNLDTRFERHRLRTDDRLDKIVAGVSQIQQAQALEAGKDEANTQAETKATTKRTQRIAIRGNLITAASIFATLASTAAVVMSALVALH